MSNRLALVAKIKLNIVPKRDISKWKSHYFSIKFKIFKPLYKFSDDFVSELFKFFHNSLFGNKIGKFFTLETWSQTVTRLG